ncbi:nitrite and sulphite reductase 4Fe-4S region [Thermocrinis albus DSM 14484]|uniref:Nitrite and sulphite reductase 4Fe-4S region n=1 Tax=Thermocrinis albus (strain DSM 14484 / JCM 11386 / HI 11/12) TaxID=638303 RepID=D3SMH7_THEAH|nr:FAD-dependent oxidoreductase [Thermocrinis albus]ADC89957.1 nitrite and sulphite reductase 4Fe-4S region [Thermocrinis albus DSM 14484]
MRVAVIGGGIAGSAMVEELLRLDPDTEIHLFCGEGVLPYNRVQLADVLSGKKLFTQLVLHSWQYYEEKGVRLHFQKVDRLYPHRRLLITERGDVYSYDRAVIATGSVPLLPPIKKTHLKGVFVLRTIKDVYGMLDMLPLSRRVVVIGGGLLGVESARAIRDSGVDVFLIHIMDTLMEQWIDRQCSQLVKNKLERLGIKVLLSKRVEELLGEKRVEGVRFSDGDTLEADMVLLATGIRANTDLAVRSGLKVERGILVDDYLETSSQYVYAVGECAQHRGKIYGIVAPILEQVKVCAKNIIYGNVERYEGSPSYTILKVPEIRLVSGGRVHEEEGDEVFVYMDNDNYRKVVLREGKLEGFVLLGNFSGLSQLLDVMKKGVNAKHLFPNILLSDILRPSTTEDLVGKTVCNCNAVSYEDILNAIKLGAKSLEDIQRMTRASTSCGSCIPLVENILQQHVKIQRKVNRVEEYKRERHPFSVNLRKRLEEWAEEGDWQKVPEEDREYGLKWYGVFYRKATPGYFMVRIRITNGVLTAQQAKVIAHLAKKFGRNEVDITSRQQIQLRWIELRYLPEVLAALETVGLTTLQTGMDNVRNITGDPLSGLHEENVIDTVFITRRMTEIFLGKIQYANLPRKFNVGVLGSIRDMINCKFNDLCFYLAKKNGKYGFNVYAGGKMGSGGPNEAWNLDIFVEPYDAIWILKAVIEIYNDLGNREDRSKNRLHFLIRELGVEGFRAELEKRMVKKLPAAGEDMVRWCGEREGLIRLRNGLYAVPLIVPAGIFTGDALQRAAWLAQKYGSGELRLSTYQRLFIVNVPQENLNQLLSDPLLDKYPISTSPFFTGLIACQGSRTCAFGVIENKPDALRLADYLSRKYNTSIPIRMHWSGCAKGCGLHGAGDIGFVGTKMKVDGEVKLAVDVFLRGKKIDTVPLDSLEAYVEKLFVDNFLQEVKDEGSGHPACQS